MSQTDNGPEKPTDESKAAAPEATDSKEPDKAAGEASASEPKKPKTKPAGKARLAKVLRPKDVDRNTADAGPLGLTGTAWLGLALVPWVIYWIAAQIAPGLWWLHLGLGAVLGIMLITYRTLYSKPTWLDLATPIYFVAGLILSPICGVSRVMFGPWGGLLSSLTIAGLLMTSLAAKSTLIAAYVRFDHPADEVEGPTFAQTNRLITVVWGLGFMVAGLCALAATLPGREFLYTPFRYLIFLLMVVFGVLFPRWYPNYLARRTSRAAQKAGQEKAAGER